MEEIVLETRQLTKRFSRRILAVDALDLTIHRGQIFGLLGPNGSGKTTTLGMLLGVVAKTSGSFSWFGQGERDSLRKRVGAILEQPNFYPFLNAEQNLAVHARIKDLRAPDYAGVLHMVGLYDRRKDPFRSYSLGMKQRLAIAGALLADPPVLIFDEPTNGLDPQGIADIRQLILDIRRMDKTIFLASHLLDEVQKVCTDFAVLRRGKKIYSGSVADAMRPTRTVAVEATSRQRLEEELRACGRLTAIQSLPDHVRVDLAEDWDVAGLNHYLVSRGVGVTYIEQRRSSLEERFLEILRDNDVVDPNRKGI
jgi:ABC-2 type transport system ATP-binding protein